MNNKNLFVKATNMIWTLFVIGLCALVTSSLLVFLILSVKLNAITLVFYLIGLLLVGPTMGAIFQTVFQTLNETDSKVIQTYFHYYLSGFKSSMLLWLPYYFIMIILCADLYFVSLNGKGTILIPLLLLILILSMISYVYSLILYSKFVMEIKDIIRFSLFLLVNRPLKSLIIIFLLLALYQFYKHFGNFAIFWGFPLFSMLSFLFLRKLLVQIEMKYVN
ncbi:YesL family protein [Bacillus sp. UNC41MFS5]|uniref:YesL family protein n=1 Tax=Bacillus sp. UNC41MFS5 TaxID=1449046 RepID=UPI00047E4598|nr:YesL family protein [Bacillus sp. UNC41MFS5]